MLDFLDRIGRPLTRLAAMALMCAAVWFFIRWGDALTLGLRRWANGDGVDLNGLAAVIGSTAALLTPFAAWIVSMFRDRRLETIERTRAGGPPPGPFAPSPTFDTPPEGGPRPGGQE